MLDSCSQISILHSCQKYLQFRQSNDQPHLSNLSQAQPLPLFKHSKVPLPGLQVADVRNSLNLRRQDFSRKENYSCRASGWRLPQEKNRHLRTQRFHTTTVPVTLDRHGLKFCFCWRWWRFLRLWKSGGQCHHQNKRMGFEMLTINMGPPLPPPPPSPRNLDRRPRRHR